MPTVTALLPRPRGRFAVELDGEPWRVVAGEAVARAGLAVGRRLDRETLRTLRRELRRVDAADAAVRALRARDHSRRGLEHRLDRAGVAPAARDQAVAALERAGLLDDGRYARNRADALAERGFGDAAIRADLTAHGIEAELSEAVLATLDPEPERAKRVVERRGVTARTARYLAGRGFGEDAVAAALGPLFAPDP